MLKDMCDVIIYENNSFLHWFPSKTEFAEEPRKIRLFKEDNFRLNEHNNMYITVMTLF